VNEEEGVVAAAVVVSVVAIVTMTIGNLVEAGTVVVADALQGQLEMTPFMTALSNKESNVRDRVVRCLSGISRFATTNTNTKSTDRLLV
jgi:flagellar basal body-associated protein FliL